MASICHRCIFRIQRAGRADFSTPAIRAFSQSTARPRSLPKFQPSENEELNQVLASLRQHHFIPAALEPAQKRLIYGTKKKQWLEENPQTVQVGGEDVNLQWIDRRHDIPARKPLISKATTLIANEKDNAAWENLPILLEALHDPKFNPQNEKNDPVKDETYQKLVRKAFHQRKIGYIFKCLHQSERTGLTLQKRGVLEMLVTGLRDLAQKSNWEQGQLAKMITYMNQIAILLETEEHGGNATLRDVDPRSDPHIIGAMLELAAMYAYKHAPEHLALVRTYAGRLLSCLRGAAPVSELRLAARGPQHAFISNIPIWQGLSLAAKLLKDDLPQHDVAVDVIAAYDAKLSQLAAELEGRDPKPQSYDSEALQTWKKCVRD